MSQKKSILTDVVIMRLLLIFLLVVYHAFCIYCGGWNKPFEEFPSVPIYDWIGSLTHEFQLQSMVFISGLLFGSSVFRNPQKLSFDSCVLRKAKRLLLPCYVFGITYWMMFNETPSLSIAHIGGGNFKDCQWHRSSLVSSHAILVFCNNIRS